MLPRMPAVAGGGAPSEAVGRQAGGSSGSSGSSSSQATPATAAQAAAPDIVGSAEQQQDAPGCPDLRTCLLNQKLQVLNTCVYR